MNTLHMRSQLSAGSNVVTTHNTSGCWSLVRKTRPKYLPSVPVGKLNREGRLITDQEGLKKLYLETFLWRLRDRPMKPDLVEIQSVKTKLFKTILKSCTKKRTQPWTPEDLEKVLNSLNKNKCCDPNGMVHELFSTQVAGKDLKALLLYCLTALKILKK